MEHACSEFPIEMIRTHNEPFNRHPIRAGMGKGSHFCFLFWLTVTEKDTLAGGDE
jgi:hypothetical protein